MIVKKENKWLVMDSAGKKVLGTHYSKADAMDQLSAIEISKKRRKEIEESPNLLNNSMNSLTEYYKKLCDDLKIQRMVLEAKVKEEKAKKAHKKGDKKADKDYDGDGKVESGSEEYLGSRSNAIKKAVAKREGKELKEYTLGGGYKFYGPGRQNPDESDMNYMPTADELKYMRDMRARGLDPQGRPLASRTSSSSNTNTSSSTDFSPNDTIEDRVRKTEERRRREKAELDAMRQKGEEVGGVPAHDPNPGPPPPPPNNEQDELAAMRRKAEEIGGVPMPDSGDNLPGMDLTAQTPEQIDAANQAQTGRFGGRPTTGMAQRQPKSMSGAPTASPEAGSMMQPYAGRSPQNDGLRRGSAPRRSGQGDGASMLDRAQALLQFVTTGDFNARQGANLGGSSLNRASQPSLVDRLSSSSTRKPTPAGGARTSPRFARMSEEVEKAMNTLGGNINGNLPDIRGNGMVSDNTYVQNALNRLNTKGNK